eukprot:3102549-Heterocapsa_arctica.AAC.1
MRQEPRSYPELCLESNPTYSGGLTHPCNPAPDSTSCTRPLETSLAQVSVSRDPIKDAQKQVRQCYTYIDL